MASSDLPIHAGLVLTGDEIVETASRSSGPGGQHVNKSNTRVTLRWNVPRSRCLRAEQRERILRKLAGRLTREGNLVVHAQRHRSRARNRELARERLAELVSDGLAVPPTRTRTRPTRSSRERKLQAKHRRSEVKQRRRRPTPED